ncbi:MAG TPA: ABC transporter permease [Bryobacteraceae bacterium]|jgi:putative ABC transport system permease protein
MDSLFHDLRFGLRILWRYKGTSAAVILALALGIGANSAMFSMVDAVLLHPAHYPDPASLAVVRDRDPQGVLRSTTAANYLDWRSRAQSFSDLAAMSGASFVLTGADRPEQIPGASVTANFFRVLGVPPLLGRAFLPDEDGLSNSEDASHVAVISYRMWRQSLGADPNVLGRTVTLSDVPYAVIGVMPPDFEFRTPDYDVWVPASLLRTNRDFHYLVVVGRLRAPRAQASVEMSTIAGALALSYPRTNKGWSVQVDDFREFLVNSTFRQRVILLSSALGLVLIIACANVASLLLARSAGRTQEIAVRISMGATRVRLLRQLLTESVLLALAGGVAGLALAQLLIRAAPSFLPSFAMPNAAPLELSRSVLLFTIAVSFATGILFGLAPALAATRPDIQPTLQQSGRGAAGSAPRRFFRRSLVVVEVAFAFMLLAGAGLMIRSFQKLSQLDLGFNAHNLLAWTLYLPSTKYDPAHALAFHQRALDRVKALPGVESVAVASNLPLRDASMEVPFALDIAPLQESDAPRVAYISISPEYVSTLGIPLRRGRVFTAADTAGSPPVVIVNEAFARRYSQGRELLGRRLTLSRPKLGSNNFEPPSQAEIVGVIGDVMLGRPAPQGTPILYVPHAQNVWRRYAEFAVRTKMDPAQLLSAVHRELLEIDKDQPIDREGSVEEEVSARFSEPRFQAQLMGSFAGLALLLALAGIYGINAHAVASRSREIGLRMALGATPGRVQRDLVAEGLRLTAIGIAIGLAGALAMSTVLAKVIQGVSATDPLTLFGSVVVLTAAASAACYLPARQATRIDPAEALRQ